MSRRATLVPKKQLANSILCHKFRSLARQFATTAVVSLLMVTTAGRLTLPLSRSDGSPYGVTAGYFYDTFAYEICFYGIYIYGIYIYGKYFYRGLKFISINCTVVRNT